jgi:hypothetical protein
VSNYLSVQKTFEQAIDRGWTSHRSKELDELVEAIRLHIQSPTQGHVYDVRNKFVIWQNKNPKEFFDRGSSLAADFNQEVRTIMEGFGLAWKQFDPDDESDDDLGDMPRLALELPEAPAASMNRWNRLKKGANATSKAIDKGLTVASHVSTIGGAATYVGVPGAQIATAGVAAAIAATGVGAAVVGVGIQAVTTGLAVYSVRSTGTHLKNLLAIYYARNTQALSRCAPIGFQENPLDAGAVIPANDDRQHDLIGNQVLPYIIRQKGKKRKRKAVAAVPILGATEGARALIHKGRKWKKGTLGKERDNAAGLLSAHFLECDCQMSQAIIAELYSGPEMEWMKGREYDEVQALIGDKMKSV